MKTGDYSMSVRSLRVQSDGKVVLAANVHGDIALLRFLPTGKLDADFGKGGWAVLDFGPDDSLGDVILQPDDKIVGVTSANGAGIIFRVHTDSTPPTVAGTAPTHGAVAVPLNTALSATFSEAMLPESIDPASFTLKDGAGYSVPGRVAYDAANHIATFTPSGMLVAGQTYNAAIGLAAKDLAGNGLAREWSWSFSTAPPDVTPPAVNGTTPANGAADAPVDSVIRATFSEDMDSASLTTASFSLSRGLAGRVTYDLFTRSAAFIPDAPLEHSTTYTATLNTDVKDASGNRLTAARKWSFRTVAQAGDADGDGVPDNQDDTPNDAALASPPAATGTGNYTVDVSGAPGARLAGGAARAESHQSVSPRNKPAGYSFPHGLLSYQVEGLAPGATVQVKVQLPAEPGPGDVCFKTDSHGFSDFGANAVRNGRTLTLPLTDGGPGDADGLANGVIEDPVGIASPVAGGGGGGGGGGGCVLSPGSGLGLDLLAALLAPALLALRRRLPGRAQPPRAR